MQIFILKITIFGIGKVHPPPHPHPQDIMHLPSPAVVNSKSLQTVLPFIWELISMLYVKLLYSGIYILHTYLKMGKRNLVIVIHSYVAIAKSV